MESSCTEKYLLAFDFDHTLIDDNSDISITSLAPNKKIPDHLKAMYRNDGWTQYMGEIFKFLHKEGIRRKDYFECLNNIKFTDGIKDLLEKLDRNKTEFIIISDANQVFIEEMLKTAGLRDYFKSVYTNPAHFNDNGCLEIEMFHYQTYCPLSTKNLCKGKILHDHVEARRKEGTEFQIIAYVGDGTNDFCPSLRLKSFDCVFPRVGFKLVDYIEKMKLEKDLTIKANIYPWKTGADILNQLLPLFNDSSLNKSLPSPRVEDPSKLNKNS